jgi:hypothetical protein
MPPSPVTFIGAFHSRTQDADGEWKLVLKAPASEDAKIAKLSPFFGERVVKVTVAMHKGQESLVLTQGEDDEPEIQED